MSQQNKSLTLGSLFDGSGGFPLGGLFDVIIMCYNRDGKYDPIIKAHNYKIEQIKNIEAREVEMNMENAQNADEMLVEPQRK